LWVTVLIIVVLSILRFIRLIKKGEEYGKKPASDESDSTGTKGTP
jgi:hypothetical protein